MTGRRILLPCPWRRASSVPSSGRTSQGAGRGHTVTRKSPPGVSAILAISARRNVTITSARYASTRGNVMIGAVDTLPRRK